MLFFRYIIHNPNIIPQFRVKFSKTQFRKTQFFPSNKNLCFVMSSKNAGVFMFTCPRVTLDLGDVDDPGEGHVFRVRFIAVIFEITGIVTRFSERKFGGTPFTRCFGPKDEYFELVISGRWGGRDVTTSFLLHRESLYLYAYRVHSDPEGHWIVTNGFGMDEDSKGNGSKKKEAYFGESYDSEMEETEVSRFSLLKALSFLNSEGGAEKKKHKRAFQSVCLHIAESVRFRRIFDFVASSFFSWSQYTPTRIPSGILEPIRNWDSMSSSVMRGLSSAADILRCGRFQRDEADYLKDEEKKEEEEEKKKHKKLEPDKG